MTNLSDTLAALSEAAEREAADIAHYSGGPTHNTAMAKFLVALETAYRTGQLVPVPSVERVADAIEACMGPLFGSPEYLADPVKRARAEKRRREGAVVYATAVITAMQEEQGNG